MKILSFRCVVISTLFFFSCQDKAADKKKPADTLPTVQAISTPVTPIAGGFLEDLFEIKSEAELKEKFGAAHISVDTIWGEQGAYALGSFIDAHTKNEVQLMWKDYPKCTGISEVIIQAYSSSLKAEKFSNEWKSKTGIKIGMTTGELEKLNGKPFVIEQFHENVTGAISDWRGGNLNEKKIHLEISGAGKMNQLSQKELDELFNHYNIPSDNKVVEKVQPWVVKVAVR